MWYFRADWHKLPRFVLCASLIPTNQTPLHHAYIYACIYGPVLFHANRHTGSGRRLDNRPSILECGVIMEDVWGSKALSRRGAFRHCLNGEAEPALVFETGRAR